MTTPPTVDTKAVAVRRDDPDYTLGVRLGIAVAALDAEDAIDELANVNEILAEPTDRAPSWVARMQGYAAGLAAELRGAA
jgi:hypothetical protein